MIALFVEPYRITVKDDPDGTHTSPGLLMGLFHGDAGVEGIILREDGSLIFLPVYLFTIDFRFIEDADRWVDSTATNAGQELPPE